MSAELNVRSMCKRSPKVPSKKSDSAISPFLRLCANSDETYAYRTMRRLLSPDGRSCLNGCDAFGCTALMYALRYRRYRLFQWLIRDESLRVNLRARDRLGNGILHYAILYGGRDTSIIDQLIEKLTRSPSDLDERNDLGFTPLLWAAFCGRYDLVHTLLTKTAASPFARDRLQHKNIFDYVKDDIFTQPFAHSTISSRQDTVRHHPSKNFFEETPPQTIRRQPETIRRLLIEHSSPSDLRQLQNYLNQRYPRSHTTKPGFNSKTQIHHLLNLFDPNPRPKILPPLPAPTKKPMTFKTLSTKLTTINAFARVPLKKKRASAPEQISTGG